jgi:hypothetical protein
MRTIKEATDIEIKATLFDIQQTIARFQNDAKALWDELAQREKDRVVVPEVVEKADN